MLEPSKKVKKKYIKSGKSKHWRPMVKPKPEPVKCEQSQKNPGMMLDTSRYHKAIREFFAETDKQLKCFSTLVDILLQLRKLQSKSVDEYTQTDENIDKSKRRSVIISQLLLQLLKDKVWKYASLTLDERELLSDEVTSALVGDPAIYPDEQEELWHDIMRELGFLDDQKLSCVWYLNLG